MKKIKIEIKNRFTDKILFSYESENNTLKETLEKARKKGACLRGAFLENADLKNAYLENADLKNAYLKNADMRGTYLENADLENADLRGAYLKNAYMRGADLRGTYLENADLRGTYLENAYLKNVDLRGTYLRGDDEKIKIKTLAVFSGLYKYDLIPFISDKGIEWLKMGCFTRKLSDWEKDFWNNKSEFPNDKSEKSELRKMAFETAKKWFKIKDNEK